MAHVSLAMMERFMIAKETIVSIVPQAQVTTKQQEPAVIALREHITTLQSILVLLVQIIPIITLLLRPALLVQMGHYTTQQEKYVYIALKALTIISPQECALLALKGLIIRLLLTLVFHVQTEEPMIRKESIVQTARQELATINQ